MNCCEYSNSAESCEANMKQTNIQGFLGPAGNPGVDGLKGDVGIPGVDGVPGAK
ncbi:Collagen alpha-1(XIV) chain, partial [Dissostichus eleginoides]